MGDDFSAYRERSSGYSSPSSVGTEWANGPSGNVANGPVANLPLDFLSSTLLELSAVNWTQLIAQAVISALVIHLTLKALYKSPIEEWLGLD